MRQKTYDLTEMLDYERKRNGDSSSHETYDPLVAMVLDLIYSRLGVIMIIQSVLP